MGVAQGGMARTLGLLAISLAFVGLGVFLLFAGGASERALALACIVFFGACAAVFLFQLLPKRPLVPEADGAVIVRGQRAQFLVLGLAATAFAAASPTLGALAAAEHAWIHATIIWFGVAFFGAGALYLFRRAARAGDLLRLDAEGVSSLVGAKWRLPWTAIVALRPFNIHGQVFLGLELSPDFPTRPSLGARLSGLIGAPQFAIGAQGSAATFEDLAQHAERLWRAAHAQR